MGKEEVSPWCEEGVPFSSSHQTRATAMPASPRRAVALVTAFCAADDLATTARRTGFVQRTSQMTGKRLLALVTWGGWRDATTTLAPWAAQVTPVGAPLAVAPAALQQSMQNRALGLLQARIRQALTTVHPRDPGCAAGLW